MRIRQLCARLGDGLAARLKGLLPTRRGVPGATVVRAKRPRWILPSVAAVFLAVVASVIVWSAGIPIAGMGPANEAGEATLEEPLDVVFVADFSGNDKLVGLDLERGFADALARHGSSQRLRIVRRDDEGKPEATLALAEGAASGFRTLAIVGPGQTRGYAAFAQQAEEGGVPVLVPVAPPGPSSAGKWVYTLQPSQQLQAELAARMLAQIRPAARVSMVTLAASGAGYWNGIRNAFVGRSATLREIDPGSSPAMVEAMAESLSTSDMTFVDLPSELAAALVKGLRDSGYKGRIVGFGDMALTGFGERFRGLPKERLSPGYYTQGVLTITTFSPDEVDERSRGLVDAHHARYGADPSWAYAYGYDVGTMLTDFVAIKDSQANPASGSTGVATGQSDRATQKVDPDEWRESLREYMAALTVAARPTSGFTGLIAFDETRQRDTQPSVLTYSDGRAVPYDRQFSHQPARVDARADDRVREVEVAGRFYDVVPIAFSGIRFHSIGSIDIDDGNYTADFELWFRSPIRIEPEDVFFSNAVDGSIKGIVVESLKDDERFYQRLRVQGKVRFDASPKDLLLERITLPLSWRHKQLEVGGLRLVIDSASFASVTGSAAIHEQIASERVMAAATGFRAVTSVLGVESRPVRALGDPRARAGQLIYSETTMKVVVESTTSSLGPALARRVPALVAVAASLVLLATGFTLRRRRQGSPVARVLTILSFIGALLLGEVALFGSSLLVNSPQRWVVWIRYGITIGYYMAAAFMINALIWGLLRRSRGGLMVQGTIHLLTSSAVYACMFAAYYTNVLGRDVLPILATSSVLLTVIGLALRELILDAISGVALHVEGSVKVGQWISVMNGGATLNGIVEELGWRTFRIRSRDDEVHFVPNASIVQHVMSNLSLSNGFTRVEVPFEISSGAEVGLVLDTLARAVRDLLSGDPDVDPARPVQLVCREIDGEGTEMAVQVFFRAGRSVDSLSTRILQTVSSVLIRLDALPTRRISLDRPEKMKALGVSA